MISSSRGVFSGSMLILLFCVEKSKVVVVRENDENYFLQLDFD